ncbi:hypothetical protein DH2020_036999 [Rehmannia glutinosa]|uniref:Pentatricopeptide repeat-containing protein n=1 Tax=Rehmannia glutinosa TaxID=99300 RepID=A0ABR0V2M6_REHGL
MSTKTAGSWNALIAGHLQLGRPSEAFNLFREMVNKCELDLIALANGLLICADLGYLLIGKSIHCHIYRKGVHLDLVGTTSLIDMYSRCMHLSAAMNVFYRTEDKDDALFNVMIAGYIHNGYVYRAVETFQEMVTMCVRPNTGTIISVLSALSDMKTIRIGKSIHGYLFRQGLEANTDISNQFINMYAKCGSIDFASDKWGKFEMARNLFEHMDEKHLSTWNTMIAAYGMHGEFDQVLKLLTQMRKDNIAPDRVTFKSILSACSHNGLVEEGLCVFSSMEREYGIVPSDEHYGCIVDLLGRAGRLQEAYDILEHVPSRRNASNVGALLAACRIHGNSEMGERVGQWLLDVDPENASVYCSVSNLYAGGGRWDEVERIGDITKGKGLKRTPGFSRIDLN